MTKFLAVLVMLFLFTTSCEQEEIFISDENSLSEIQKNELFKTLPIQESLDFFKRKDQLKIGLKGKNSIYVTPNLSKIEHEELTNTNAKLTVIPAEISIPNINTRILQTKSVNGDIISLIFNMIPDDSNNTENSFTGIILLTGLEGKFIEAYRVKEGIYVSKFLKKSVVGENKEIDDTMAYACVEDYAAGIFCDQDLDEIIITVPPSNTSNVYPYVPRIGSSWSYYNNQYYGYGTGYIKYLRSLPCDGSGQVRNVNGQCVDDNVYNELEGRAKCVYEKLEDTNGNLFKKTIGEFIDDPTYDLTLENGNCENTDIACTDGNNVSNGDIRIIIEDNYQSPLNMAATILHEGIHAEIFRFVDMKENDLVDPNDRARLSQLYIYYNTYISDGNIDHIYMTEKYIKPIANALRELDGFNYPTEYYFAYAWDGLRAWDWNPEFALSDEDNLTYERYRDIVEANSQFTCN